MAEIARSALQPRLLVAADGVPPACHCFLTGSVRCQAWMKAGVDLDQSGRSACLHWSVCLRSSFWAPLMDRFTPNGPARPAAQLVAAVSAGLIVSLVWLALAEPICRPLVARRGGTAGRLLLRQPGYRHRCLPPRIGQRRRRRGSGASLYDERLPGRNAAWPPVEDLISRSPGVSPRCTS